MSDLLNSASLVLIPSGYKEDTVYSVVPSDGSGDMAFTRASNGTRVNSAGLVEVCPWNLLQQSETFDNATWQKSGINVTANSVANPLTGLINADNLVADTGNNFHYIYQPITYTTDQHTIFVYLKANGYNWFVIDSGLSNKYSYYNLSTGVLGTAGSGATASIESAGNGWYKCGVTFAGVAGSTGIYLSVRNADNGGAFTGNGTGGILAYGAQLNIGSTAKPYFPTTDRLNVPRLTYQNGGGGCPSLLLEKQSTNKCPSSNNFGTSAVQTTVTRNVTTSPAGVSDADRLLDTSANDEHLFGQNFDSITNGLTYTISVFFKADGSGGRGVIRYYGGEWVYAVYNLATGVVSFSEGSITTKIENYGNGWYRCMLTHTAIMDYTPMVTQIGIANSSNQFSYQGASNLGVYFWGFQAEQSSYVTSLIETNGSSATRVADACFKTGISSLIGQTEGVLFVDVNLSTRNIAGFYFGLRDLSIPNYIMFFIGTSSIIAQVYNSGSALLYSTFTNNSTGRFKIAIAYKNNDFVFYANGSLIGSATSGTVPTCNELFNGEEYSINQFYLSKTRLTNAELASLTTI